MASFRLLRWADCVRLALDLATMRRTSRPEGGVGLPQRKYRLASRFRAISARGTGGLRRGGRRRLPLNLGIS